MLLKLTTVVVAFLVWTPVASAWSWPVKGPVLQPFSYDEAHPYAAGQHRGIDIGANATGDPVVAPESGTVSFAGFVPTSGESVSIETADGYSVTLTHLGSIGVAKGAAVVEGDVVGTVGPSGAPEQSVPYVHLGVRVTSDPLGYLDPVGLLPAAEPTPPAPAPAPAPQPGTKAVPAPRHASRGGLVIKRPAAAPRAVAAPVKPVHAAAPKTNPNPKPIAKPNPVHATRQVRTDVPQMPRLLTEPLPAAVPVVVKPFAHAIEAEPLVLSIGPGIVAALLALVTAFTRGRRPTPITARVIPLRKELPLRRAA